MYTVPFAPAEQRLSPEERGEVAACGANWTKLLREAVGAIRDDVFKEDPDDPGGAIPGEFQWWTQRAEKLRNIRKELATPSVQR